MSHKFFSLLFLFQWAILIKPSKKMSHFKTLEAHQLVLVYSLKNQEVGINSLNKLSYAIFFAHLLSKHFLLTLLPLSKWILKNIITIDEHKNNILLVFFCLSWWFNIITIDVTLQQLALHQHYNVTTLVPTSVIEANGTLREKCMDRFVNK